MSNPTGDALAAFCKEHPDTPICNLEDKDKAAKALAEYEDKKGTCPQCQFKVEI